MSPEEQQGDSKNKAKPEIVVPPLITGIFAVITTCISAIAIVYSAYLTRENRQIQATSTVISGTATQFVLLTKNAPTATFPPTFTPLPTYTDQPTYTPPPTYTPFPTFTSVPTPDALFKDDFSDNHNNWDLSNAATISNGELSITVKPKEEVWLTLPNFKINSENYYIQAKMAMTTKFCGCYNGFGLGFGLGEKDTSYHKVFFGNWVNSFNFRQYVVNFYDNGNKLYSEATSDKIWLWGEYHSIRIEYKSGQVTLYHDGVATITKQITPHGNDLGFYAANYEGGDLTFSFDDLVVRELP